jgi:hypothetical protein
MNISAIVPKAIAIKNGIVTLKFKNIIPISKKGHIGVDINKTKTIGTYHIIPDGISPNSVNKLFTIIVLCYL